MEKFTDFILKVPGLPLENLLVLTALMAIGLAGFAIYVVFAIVSRRDK